MTGLIPMMLPTCRNVLLALVLTAALAKAAIPPIAMLFIQTKGAAVNVTLNIANNSDFELLIESYNVFADGHLTSPVFTIQCDGREVAYTGPMVKRRRPIASDYIRIPAHGQRSFTADLAKFYSFPSGKHSYKVVFESIYTLPAKESFYMLRSDPIIFDR